MQGLFAIVGSGKARSFPKTVGAWLLIPLKILAALVSNLVQLLMIGLLLFLAGLLAGWKLLSLRKQAQSPKHSAFERSPVPDRQR